jgi:hypothetical protein
MQALALPILAREALRAPGDTPDEATVIESAVPATLPGAEPTEL